MKKTIFIVLFFFLISFSIFSNDQNSIIYLRAADSTSLDPGKVHTIYSADIVSNIFEGLVKYDLKNHKISPCLAERWESSENGLKWNFYLRKNVFFHDGTHFDSSAVLHSFLVRKKKMNTDYPEWKISFPNIVSITSSGKYKIEIILKKPYAPFLTLLTFPIAYIVHPKSYLSKDFYPVGTGPFIFEKWERGKFISLMGNKKYWNGTVKLLKVIFKIYRNQESAINMIKNGQADVMELKSIELYQNFLGLKKFIITQSPPGGIFFIVFNTTKYPFNRVEFRRGFAHLIKKKVMIKTIFQDFIQSATTPIPYTFPEFNKKITDYKLSIKKSISLFRQAGIKSGFKCSVSFLSNDKIEHRIFETFRRQTAKAGIILIKDPLPLNKLFTKLENNNFDIAIRGWVSGPDPDLYFFSNFTNIKGNSNFGKYSNPELLNILLKARETLDKKKRKQLYFKAQEIIHTDLPWISLFYQRAMIIHSRNIKNINFNLNSQILFENAYISDN